MNNSKGLLLNYKKSASIDSGIPNTTINSGFNNLNTK